MERLRAGNVNGSWEGLWDCQASFRDDLDVYLALEAETDTGLEYKTLQVRWEETPGARCGLRTSLCHARG
jgi:hypothetical protein